MSVNFLDSNVLIYLFDETNPRKRSIAQNQVNAALGKGEAIISFQVVQETLNVITKKLPVVATAEQAGRFLTSILVPLWKINPSRELYHQGLTIQSRYQYGFYDSLVIASALEAGCGTLYSEDLQHGQTIGQLSINNPFLN